MKLLYLSPFAPSPPAIGCHRRVQGLMAAMARRHEVTAVSLITPDLDVNIARRAMNMAMAKPTVSSSIGAEGIDFEHGRNVWIADDPSSFADAVGRVLDDRQLAGRLGCEARALVEKRYSWDGAAVQLERFFREILTARSQADSSKQMTLSELSG